MSGPALIIVVAAVWLTIGFVLSLVLGRRGHDGFTWFVVGTLLGPLAVLLAIDAIQNGERRRSSVVAAGSSGGGSTNLLVGIDGSPEARAALETAVAMFGTSLGRVTLVRVIPFDSGTGTDGDAAASIEREAARFPALHPRIEVARGNPATVLRELAASGSYDVLVIGSQGAGRHLFGSAARELGAASPIPVLLVSTVPSSGGPGTVASSASGSGDRTA
ncbi:MAG: universal stress protein [Acidimicrobiia bacterium]